MNPLEFQMGPLFDALVDGLCVSDGEGRIRYMNPAAERLLEMTFERLRNRHFCVALCGHLETQDYSNSAASCPLRDVNRPERKMTIEGAYNRRTAFEWNDEDFKRVEKWRNLKVRCVRARANSPRGGLHITIIEDASADAKKD